MNRWAVGLTACLLWGAAGCTLDVAGDPTGDWLGIVAGMIENFERDLENALEDPLANRPFPVLIGGDSERIFYATNLGDVRVRFPEPANELVFPGMLGPSNLYEYRDNHREMLRPLIPAGAMFESLSTDGQYVAWIEFSDDESPHPTRVVVEPLAGGPGRTLFDAADRGPRAYVAALRASGGWLAFTVSDSDAEQAWLRIEDPTGLAEPQEIELESWSAIDLRNDRVAYDPRGREQLALLDLATGETLVLVSDLASQAYIGNVVLTDNKVVWSELLGDGVSRIRAHDIPSGTTELWTDAVAGELTGAADAYFLTQDYVLGSNGVTERIVIRSHEVGGRERKLADFRADGLAGQATILGNRVVFVNDERRIVIVPLTGGDRTSFRPF